MRVRTNHRRNAAIKMVPKRGLLAGDFHVRFHNHKRTFFWKFFQHTVNRGERIIRGQRKINPSKYRGHKHVARATRRRSNANPALAWRAIGQIRGPTHWNRWILQRRSYFGIAVHMVAKRHRVGAPSRNACNKSGVIPEPLRIFSPLTMTTSAEYFSRIVGKCLATAARPGAPTTSPRNKIRIGRAILVTLYIKRGLSIGEIPRSLKFNHDYNGIS